MASWPEVKVPIRVIRSLETYSVRRQLDKKDEPQTSDWVWVTTLPSAQVPVERAVGFGHQRWDIENHGFNELVDGWHADHVLKHDPAAIECFLLMTFLAFILFHAFLYLNVKPAFRQGKSKEFWARVMAAEIYRRFHPIRHVTVMPRLQLLVLLDPSLPNSSLPSGICAVLRSIS